LVIGRIGPVDFGALVPVETKPSEPVQDRAQRLGDVPLGVGVVDPQQELATVPSGEQPVKQGRTDAADVEIAGRAGCEAGADRRHGLNDYNDRLPLLDLAATTHTGETPCAGF